MKRLLVVVILLILALAAIGCEKKATPTLGPAATSVTTATATPKTTPAPTAIATATPTRTPTPNLTPTALSKPEGQLRIAAASYQQETLDPIKSASYAKVLHTVMYDFLVGSTPDGELSTKNGIAYKWENSTDYKSWTFYLRDGIKFHNGDDLTAEDVKFSMEHLGDPGAMSPFARLVYSMIQEIVVDGSYKLTVHLKRADFFFPYRLTNLSAQEGLVLPKKYYEAVGPDEFEKHPVGSGPYRFMEHAFDQHVTFEAVDNHWWLGVPKYKTITFYKVPEEITRIAMLKSGQVDIIATSREQAAQLQKAGFNLFLQPSGQAVYLNPHVYIGTSNPLSDKRVREALDLAIDKKTILDTLFLGQGKLIPSTYEYPFVLGSVDLEPTGYDPERAKQLLKEAGYPERFDPEITLLSTPQPIVPEAAAMLEAIATYWKNVGVKVKIEPMDTTTYRSKLAAKTVGSAFYLISSPPNKLSPTTASVGRSVPPGAWSFFTDPPDLGYDAILDELAAAKTQDEFIEAAKKIPQYTYDNARNITLFSVDQIQATNDKVKEWDMGYYYFDVNLISLAKR